MNHLRFSIFCGWLALLTACTDDTATGTRTTTAAVERQTVDLILHNARVLTLDAADTIASVLVVDEGRIVATGGDELLERYRSERQVDATGRTVLPGFIDSHIHISGKPAHYIDLTKATSVAGIVELVQAKAAAVGPGNWITGYGWSEDQLSEQRRPLLEDLDAAAPGNPVILTRAGSHSAVVSSTALALAGIDATTPNPDGGVIERDQAGNLNGIIRERHNLVAALVPPTPPEALRPSLIAELQALFALGITSIIQAREASAYYPEWEAVYAANQHRLPRASVQIAWEGLEAMRAFGRKTGDGDLHLRVGPAKIFADGGFTGPAAYTSKPYKGQDEYRGALNMSEAELETMIMDAHREGWQLGIHAIGDAAITLTVKNLVSALQAQPRSDHRHFLNHFTLMPASNSMDDMATHGIAITQQPNFTYTLEGRYVANLDGERLETNNPLRTPMNHGIHVAISSDILPVGPMVGIYAAVTRKGRSGRVFGPGEKISRLEALRGYTIAGAWLTREEALKGTLEPGKLADLIVLSADPLTVADEDILNIRVDQTYLAGNLVYGRTL